MRVRTSGPNMSSCRCEASRKYARRRSAVRSSCRVCSCFTNFSVRLRSLRFLSSWLADSSDPIDAVDRRLLFFDRCLSVIADDPSMEDGARPALPGSSSSVAHGPSESGVARPEDDGRRERWGVPPGEGEGECEGGGLLNVRCSCAVSSESDCGGGKGGQALRLTIARFDSCGSGCNIAGEGDRDGAEEDTRPWAKCGIVEMRGDNAHGFVLDARSCSNVGSMRLRWRRGRWR